VIFTSDNGPVVDDGYQDEAVAKLGDHKPAGPLRGGKYSNFDGGTRVPMIARWPGHIRSDRRSDALISQVDLLASLTAVAGGEVGDGVVPDSENVMPALLGESSTARRSLVEHAGSLALVEGNWKLIEPGKGQKINRNTNTELGNDPEPQLYDLSADIGEKNNVAARYPDRVRTMMAELNRIRER
jgi:arylsulfatase A-like enzyme